MEGSSFGIHRDSKNLNTIDLDCKISKTKEEHKKGDYLRVRSYGMEKCSQLCLLQHSIRAHTAADIYAIRTDETNRLIHVLRPQAAGQKEGNVDSFADLPGQAPIVPPPCSTKLLD